MNSQQCYSYKMEITSLQWSSPFSFTLVAKTIYPPILTTWRRFSKIVRSKSTFTPPLLQIRVGATTKSYVLLCAFSILSFCPKTTWYSSLYELCSFAQSSIIWLLSKPTILSKPSCFRYWPKKPGPQPTSRTSTISLSSAQQRLETINWQILGGKPCFILSSSSFPCRPGLAGLPMLLLLSLRPPSIFGGLLYKLQSFSPVRSILFISALSDEISLPLILFSFYYFSASARAKSSSYILFSDRF